MHVGANQSVAAGGYEGYGGLNQSIGSHVSGAKSAVIRVRGQMPNTLWQRGVISNQKVASVALPYQK